MRNIEYRPRAYHDFEAIISYIILILGSPQAARNTADLIIAAIENIAQLPESGQVFDDKDLDNSYRRTLADRYWIYYRFASDTLTIWRIFHIRQNTEDFGFENL